jgi:hypothetical protein
VEPDEVDISLSRGVLSIGGERNPRPDQAGEVSYYTHERRFGSFRRSITLPESVARDDLRASLENGPARDPRRRRRAPATTSSGSRSAGAESARPVPVDDRAAGGGR